MNKKLILLNTMLILGLLLGACGPSSITIQVPADDSGGAPPAPGTGTDPGTGMGTGSATMMLIYVLMGALVVIALAALLGGKRGNQ